MSTPHSHVAWLRVTASVALLAVVMLLVDPRAIVDRLAHLRMPWVGLALVVSVVQAVVLAWRWRFTASRLGLALPFPVALREYYLGLFLNQVLPGGVPGDVSRAWRHARSAAPARPAVGAVVLERASAQAVMTTVAAVSFVAVPLGHVAQRVLVLAVLLGLFVGVFAALRRIRPDGSALARAWAEARSAVLDRGALGLHVGTALFLVASYVGVYLIAARAVGVDTPLLTLLPLVAPVLMTMLVPLTVAGWGIREGAAAALWASVGLTAEDGVAISVAYGLLVFVSTLPGSIVLIRAPLEGRDRRARPNPARSDGTGA